MSRVYGIDSNMCVLKVNKRVQMFLRFCMDQYIASISYKWEEIAWTGTMRWWKEASTISQGLDGSEVGQFSILVYKDSLTLLSWVVWGETSGRKNKVNMTPWDENSGMQVSMKIWNLMRVPTSAGLLNNGQCTFGAVQISKSEKNLCCKDSHVSLPACSYLTVFPLDLQNRTHFQTCTGPICLITNSAAKQVMMPRLTKVFNFIFKSKNVK